MRDHHRARGWLPTRILGAVRPRASLRGRLLIAMAAIAVGVLVVTGFTTIALARRSAERNAIAHLEEQAPSVTSQLRSLGRAVRGRRLRDQPTLGRLVTAVLRVTGGTMVTVHADGSITEGVSGLLGAAAGGGSAADGTSRRAGRPARGAVNPLPDDLTVADFDAARLRSGARQTGRVARRVFVAEAVRTGGADTTVLVLTEKVDSAATTRARGYFVIGGALALLAAGVVSYFLALRLTRPLAAMSVTAGAIAGGDLTARVDLGPHPDDELAALARTLNAMAAQLEAARHSERSFLLSVSHDLRTPLTSIRGFAEALTDGTIPATEEQRRAGAVIAAEASRLERLVADLLDLARLDARQFSLSPRAFDLAGSLRTTVDAFHPGAGELGIELAVHGPDALSVTGDPERVVQIMANLIENALKYARSRIDVEVRAEPDTDVEIRVVDDGPGVDPAEVERVFERLFVSRAVPGRSVGTGLGLAIVGELTNAMGGRATVERSATDGAAFVVRLPLVREAAVIA